MIATIKACIWTISKYVFSFRSKNTQRLKRLSPIRSTLQLPFNGESIIKSFTGNEPNLSEEEKEIGCKLGIDSHADSSCAGRHVRILEYIDGKRFSVKPFLDTYEPKNDVSLINGVVAVDTSDGGGYILELNNFLDFTDTMNDSILVPMQARYNGIIIDDVPKDLCHYGVSTQSIFSPQTDFSVPIEYNGPIPYIPVRYPTDDDLENYKWIELTSTSEWNPYPNSSISSILQYSPHSTYDNDLQNQFHDALLQSINISSVATSSRKNTLSPEDLSALWKIPLQNAKRTLNATTNNYIRTNEGRLSRRYRTDLFQKRYRRMGGVV